MKPIELWHGDCLELMKLDIFSVTLLISPKVALFVKMQISSNRFTIAVLAINAFACTFLYQIARYAKGKEGIAEAISRDV